MGPGKFLSILKRPKVCIPLITVASLVIGLAALIKNLDSPVQGVITDSGAVSNTTPAKSVPEVKSYSDKYIGFSYPGKFTLSPSQKTGGYLDVVNLISTPRRSEYVSIGVYPGDLSSDSGVTYRQRNPQIYKLLASTPSSLYFANIQTNAELTGFFMHSGLMTSVSVTANSTMDLSPDYQVITGSLSWKE